MKIKSIVINFIFATLCTLPLFIMYFVISDYVKNDKVYKVWVEGHYEVFTKRGPNEGEEFYVEGHYKTHK